MKKFAINDFVIPKPVILVCMNTATWSHSQFGIYAKMMLTCINLLMSIIKDLVIFAMFQNCFLAGHVTLIAPVTSSHLFKL